MKSVPNFRHLEFDTAGALKRLQRSSNCKLFTLRGRLFRAWSLAVSFQELQSKLLKTVGCEVAVEAEYLASQYASKRWGLKPFHSPERSPGKKVIDQPFRQAGNPCSYPKCGKLFRESKASCAVLGKGSPLVPLPVTLVLVLSYVVCYFDSQHSTRMTYSADGIGNARYGSTWLVAARHGRRKSSGIDRL
eukprot:3815666-Amphidinium_carterae.1